MIDSAAMLGRKSFRLVNRSTVALEPGDNLHPARAGVAVVMMGFLPFANEAVFVAGQQLRLCRIFQSHLRGPFKRRKIAQIFGPQRSEEHTSELQSLMRNPYAVFCLKKKH